MNLKLHKLRKGGSALPSYWNWSCRPHNVPIPFNLRHIFFSLFTGPRWVECQSVSAKLTPKLNCSMWWQKGKALLTTGSWWVNPCELSNELPMRLNYLTSELFYVSLPWSTPSHMTDCCLFSALCWLCNGPMDTKQVLGPHLQTLQPLKLQGPKGTFLYIAGLQIFCYSDGVN